MEVTYTMCETGGDFMMGMRTDDRYGNNGVKQWTRDI
jgi:hypothetical protein